MLLSVSDGSCFRKAKLRYFVIPFLLVYCYCNHSLLLAVRRTLKSGISPEDMEKLTKQVNILDSK